MLLYHHSGTFLSQITKQLVLLDYPNPMTTDVKYYWHLNFNPDDGYQDIFDDSYQRTFDSREDACSVSLLHFYHKQMVLISLNIFRKSSCLGNPPFWKVQCRMCEQNGERKVTQTKCCGYIEPCAMTAASSSGTLLLYCFTSVCFLLMVTVFITSSLKNKQK